MRSSGGRRWTASPSSPYRQLQLPQRLSHTTWKVTTDVPLAFHCSRTPITFQVVFIPIFLYRTHVDLGAIELSIGSKIHLFVTVVIDPYGKQKGEVQNTSPSLILSDWNTMRQRTLILYYYGFNRAIFGSLSHIIFQIR